jgi:hypothetical protein
LSTAHGQQTAWLDSSHRRHANNNCPLLDSNFSDGPAFVETVFDRIIEKPLCDGLGAGTAFTAIAWKLPKEELTAAFQRSWQPEI